MDAVIERLAQLDERLRALQENTARGLAAALDGQARLEAAQAETARAVTEQATAGAVLAQWIKDWTREVTNWRASVDRRIADAAARQEQMTQDADQARGALRVGLWVFGTVVTLVTGVSSGVVVRALGEALARAAR